MLYGYLPAILGGLGQTLSVAAVSLVVACLFGVAAALAKLSGRPVLRWAGEAYTTLIRGLPELILLLLVFYGGQIALNALAERLGVESFDIDPFLAGTVSIGFIFGAYLCETFRGAYLAVPRGQIEAAFAYGLSRGQVLRRVSAPQMVRHAIPGFANTWLVMVKATALISIIGLDDMVHRANLASSATREPFVFYGVIALIYLGITSVSVGALALLARRFSIGVRPVEL